MSFSLLVPSRLNKMKLAFILTEEKHVNHVHSVNNPIFSHTSVFSTRFILPTMNTDIFYM